MHLLKYLLSSLRHGLALSHLSLVVCLHALVALFDNLFLHECLSGLQLAVPLLQLRKAHVDFLSTHVTSAAGGHVELLASLIQLPC